MNSEIENIAELERAILIEAREEAEQMQVEAKQQAEAIRKRVQEQAESERKVTLERAREDAERLRSQATATAQLKARSSELEHREKVLDNVFVEVKKRLGDVNARPDYDAIASLLLREALTQLRVNKAEIRADEATQKALKKGALDQIAKELKGEFTISGGLDEGAGVVVDASGGKIHYDNTLETRLNRLQSVLRASVYKVLMGE
ncbi:MAG: V-type ATP synthase subunit E [Anaerolineales bacterium]|nr:V-type ATP synthase subunit E [Anaerolineales bacterium]